MLSMVYCFLFLSKQQKPTKLHKFMQQFQFLVFIRLNDATSARVEMLNFAINYFANIFLIFKQNCKADVIQIIKAMNTLSKVPLRLTSEKAF